MSDDEDDFMSDKFLVPAPSTSKQPTTYSDQRKRKQLDSLARSHKRSRAEREIEAREEGLSRDLIADQLVASSTQNSKHDSYALNTPGVIQPATHSKAVQMMLKMGFQPGKGLGAQPEASSPREDPSHESVASHSLLSQSSSAIERDSSHGIGHPPRTAPIDIQLRTGRSGIGVLPTTGPKKTRPRFTGPHVPMTEEEAAKRANFFQNSKAKFDGRKVEGVLARARRTCEELDRRSQLEDNIYWLDPFSSTDRSEYVEEVMRTGVSGRRLTGLGDPNEVQKTVVVSEEEDTVDSDEREAWLALDSASRLLYTLQYLRQEHFYCIWCGCQYSSLEELNAECPGEEEDDH
ncbi:hypothetical protein CROQUDRAFT_655835 [Cronartium quercuum f. sp. fusiforme G11]|uniref:G-patch domain-containing protein n=1 Tax=Cronartium quercuum f. sp. fusiforme G11 TaxID=708437 RepID=A0A9P6TED4_9BASI|nr:hypothetical protein CROQUDRAFT_655835 [Cronartium quercuum f. sp. fusiforme G11]